MRKEKGKKDLRDNNKDCLYRNVKKLRKEKIMLVLGMILAVVVALAAEVGVISNKLA